MTIEQILILAAIGLVAGTVGGLAGIGGSVIMLPGMVLIFGYADDTHAEHHLYMASAMWVNVLVAVPAAIRHGKAGAVRADIVRTLFPSMTLAIIAGVLLSNQIDGERLKLALAAFIFVYCLSNLYRLLTAGGRDAEVEERTDRGRIAISGGLTGSLAGLLGVGGGGVLVPLLQLLCRVKLRTAVAASLAIMPFTAAIGATIKLASLHSHDQRMLDALWIILALAPGAVGGGLLGADLAHRMPIKTVRISITIALALIALRLAGIL